MKILITGSHGLVGSALLSKLLSAGHTVIRLVRSQAGKSEGEIYWDPKTDYIEQDKLENLDAVVHLAGENIATGRWTKDKKRRIRNSRVDGTSLLATALGALKRKPEVFASASAIGFYGNRGSEVLNENSPAGSGFLPKTCTDWESAAEPAQKAGIRVVYLRFGVILSAKGGALGKMLFPFKLGAGGKIGDGHQYMSWISINDAVSAIQHVMRTKDISGPINIVAPQSLTNLEFTKALGKVLSRPTVLPLPALAVRFIFGEMGEELLLSSTRVEPVRLKDSGFNFQHKNIEETLRFVLGN